jgi:hypothetical protein
VNNILVFTFPPENAHCGKVEIDLRSLKMTELHDFRPIVLACRSPAYCAFLFEKFFKDRPIRAYVNIDESEEVPKLSVFLQVLVDPPRELTDRDRYFLRKIADLLCLPENGLVAQAIYGTVIPTSPENISEIKSNFQTSGVLLVGIGAIDMPGFLVLMPDEVQVARTDYYTTQLNFDFLIEVFSLPNKAWK